MDEAAFVVVAPASVHNRTMLQVAYQRWGQSPEDLLQFALEAPHRRTRERFLALYEITQGKNATQVAEQLGREDETVHNWVHGYNERGAEALIFKRSGGRSPLCPQFSSRSTT